MADHDFSQRALKEFADFVLSIERIAQDSASTESVLYSKDKSDESKRNARLAYELQREIECWDAIGVEIERRVSARKSLLDQVLQDK